MRILGERIKRVFLTGGAGFIGSHICDSLLSDGYLVTVYDNLSNGRIEFIQNHFSNANFRFVESDCLDLGRLVSEMASHDLVWHMAANTDIIGSHAQPDRDLRDCMVATFNVVESMRVNGIVPILFASSGAVYGDLCHDKAVDESAGPLSPISTYAAGKVGSEAFISSYCHLYGLRGWSFRFGNVIGARVTHGVIYDFVKRLRENSKELMILGDGTQEKNYFLTEDCIDGMAWSFRNVPLDENNPYVIFNLGSSSVTRVTDIARIVIEEMGLKDVTAVRIQGDRRAWLGDQPKVHLKVNKLKTHGWSCPRGSNDAVRIAVRRILGKDS